MACGHVMLRCAQLWATTPQSAFRLTAPLTRGDIRWRTDDLLLTGTERPEKTAVRSFQRSRAKPMDEVPSESEAEGEMSDALR